MFVVAESGLIASEPANAPEHYIVDAWQVEDGLPDNRITCIAQTPDGYLWLGTPNGLVRFDGVRFMVFDARTPGIKSPRIMSLFVEHSGALWVGTEFGDLVRLANGRFTPLDGAPGWPRKMAACFAEDENGDVLVGTANGGLFRFKDQKFVPLLPDASNEEREKVSFSGRMNLAVDARNKEVIWARTTEGLKFNEKGTWIPGPLENTSLSTQITGLASARKGGVWVCASGQLLWIRGNQPPVSRGIEVPRRKEAGCTGMIEDSAGNVWITTWGRGLFRITPNGFVKHFEARENLPPFLRCVFEDQEGNIWVATNGDGLLRLRPRVFSTYAPEPTLPRYRCNALIENPDGGLWIGTDGHGLVQLQDSKFSQPIALANLSVQRPMWAMAVDPGKRLWIGSYADGLLVKNGFTSFQRNMNDGLLNNRVYALKVARDATLWIGTDVGLSHYDGNKFQNFNWLNGLPTGGIRAIEQDALGDLWFGFSGNSGLVRKKADRFEKFSVNQGLVHNSVRCLHADQDGSLWIGTENGLSHWQGGHFTNFRVEDGLPHGKIVAILDDGLGYLWLGSGHGVFRISRSVLDAFARREISRLEFARYLKGDGLASAQCSEGSPCAIRASDGRMWFATSKGVSVVDPREVQANPVPPKVRIEEVLIDGISQTNAIDEGIVRVPTGKHRVEIQYTGISFTAPDRVRFKHRLEGFDERWQEVGAQRMASFRGLTPGDYRFHVIAANNDGVWNNVGAGLALIVQPALWQTTWFRILLVATVSVLIFLAVHARIQALQRQQAAQREFSRGLIASQEQERKRIAAELHDSLGQNLLVIKNRAAMAKTAGISAGQELDEIGRLAAQSIEEVRQISQNLRPYQLDRLGLTRALHGLVKQAGASTGVKFETDITPLERLFSSEAEVNFFRIVQEALNNVLKHSGASEARVVVERNKHRIRLMVEDNGRGFEWPPKQRDAAHGMGLNGIAERVHILGGRLEINSAPGTGTRIKVTAPIPSENI